MQNKLSRRTLLLVSSVGVVAIALLGWKLVRPGLAAREVAARVSGFPVQGGRMIQYRGASGVLSNDVTEDAVFEFAPDEFNLLRATAERAGFVLAAPNDEQWMLIRAVAPEARTVLYRAARDLANDSWRVAVLDLDARRLYASQVLRPR